jgi:hypothetical protein
MHSTLQFVHCLLRLPCSVTGTEYTYDPVDNLIGMADRMAKGVRFELFSTTP